MAEAKARHQGWHHRVLKTLEGERRALKKEQRQGFCWPTPEAKKKFRKSTLTHLVSLGKLGAPEVRAADEIVAVYRYLTQGLRLTAMSYTQRVDCAFTDHDPPWFIHAYTKRYKPWAKAHSHGFSKKGKSFALCLRILVDGAHATALCGEFNLRHGGVIELFQDALEDYARRAGWKK